ncbi:iron-sulfur cluster biosynthesis family protein [Alkalihalobacillus sp. 1P02AB]|uniref:iron-sulfur cluster biosynthesis family protein n=1 Tax=Alkalihalobacillus sp. 1P02AB TaxID=3132260 RepID=UPI0039A73763
MEIHFTEQAKKELLKHFESSTSYMCLYYELGGCCTPLDGVIRLKKITSIPDSHLKILTNGIPVYTERSNLRFLEENLIIDYQPNGFVVKSKNQIYGYSLRIEK